MRRILFLVDRNNLGKQTLDEFQKFQSPYNGYKFTEEYGVQQLKRNTIDPPAKICITTIQRLYSILKGEDDFAEENEEGSLFESASSFLKEPLPVVYNAKVPPETFDFIVVDECHRSIYNIWRQVLEYFDAFLIGLTATPTPQTIGFFNQNLVQEYNQERAIIDRVNVGYEVFRIETEISKNGARLVKDPKVFVPHRDRRTRKMQAKLLDEDLVYSAKQLDRDVVNLDQIRLVIRTFKERLPEIFPGRTKVPKTLVFAKTDSHADDIVTTIREVFGKGNDFCTKITSKSDKPHERLKEFRNMFHPRIAVTVDMIATGTDVKPLECLLFLRDVRSLTYFEQMKGRGCRVIDADLMQKVTPDSRQKTHFVIVDAVGVCESLKSTNKPLDRKPNVALAALLDLASKGAVEADLVSALADRLTKLDQQLTDEQRAEIEKIAGQPIAALSAGLLQSIDPEMIAEAAARLFNVDAASCRVLNNEDTRQVAASTSEIGYFDPSAPIAVLDGNLPHFRQPGTTYFVTFRTADSLPQVKLQQWGTERDAWLIRHPEPHTLDEKREYSRLFPERIQQWLDAGFGECLLKFPEVRQILVHALNHFEGVRYHLHEWVVMPNHVHVVVTPIGEHELSNILHSWKSFTANAIHKLLKRTGTFWQKESFDHIVRSPESLERITKYILQNPSGLPQDMYTLSPQLQTRQDAASTWEPTEKQLDEVEHEQMSKALKPFHNPKLRDKLTEARRDLDQVIDEQTPDKLLRAGFDVAALEKARSMLTSFKKFIEDNKDEIEALQVLYSLPYRAGLRHRHIKELATKLNQPPFYVDPNRPESLSRLWQAYEAVEPDKVRGKGGKQLVDLIALVRHAIDPNTPLAPVGMTVAERYQQWLAEKQTAGVTFTADQRKWLDAIKDHIASSLNIEQDDLEEVPFNRFGGLGRAYELFGAELGKILEELNLCLAA